MQSVVGLLQIGTITTPCAPPYRGQPGGITPQSTHAGCGGRNLSICEQIGLHGGVVEGEVVLVQTRHWSQWCGLTWPSMRLCRCVWGLTAVVGVVGVDKG